MNEGSDCPNGPLDDVDQLLHGVDAAPGKARGLELLDHARYEEIRNEALDDQVLIPLHLLAVVRIVLGAQIALDVVVILQVDHNLVNQFPEPADQSVQQSPLYFLGSGWLLRNRRMFLCFALFASLITGFLEAMIRNRVIPSSNIQRL